MRIGIDLGGTKIAGIVMDDDGCTRSSRRIRTPITDGYEAIVSAIAALVHDLEREVGRACPVGIGAPGQVSSKNGTMKNSNAVCLNGRPLQKDLEDALQRRIRLANDANCFALSEAIDGAARGFDVVFGVIIGTGVGGGIAMGGQLHAGRHDIAGEWGHICLDPRGPRCYCGRRGCIEMYLSGSGLMREYRDAGGLLATDASHVSRLAENHQDASASAAVAKYIANFGRALATVINILDPDAIVLGGGLSNMRCLYSDGISALSQAVFNDCMQTPILAHQHGDASGVRGAAMLWRDGSAVVAA